MSEIVISKIEKNNEFLTIYDPCCGGGNLLFGVEDRIKEISDRPIATYGQDWSDSLYALSKIESRFRENSQIEYGNTLTSTKFYDKEFDVVFTNPPQGISWKDFSKDIYNDKTGQYHFYPSKSDGQLLFNQHIISRVNHTGFAVVVHNGSALFSGDAGSGESNIRKWLFDNDYVEAIIQLPTDEFFNTNITTYIWVLNKNKSNERKKKVILIDASKKFKLLKKNKGKKRKEIDKKSREDLLKTLLEFKDNEYARVFGREYFYFDKQSIILTNIDTEGRSFEKSLNGKKSLKLNTDKVIQKSEDGEIVIDEFSIKEFDKEKFDSLKSYNDEIKSKLSNLNYKEGLKVETNGTFYYFDNEKETLVKEINGDKEKLGCGKIIIKSSYKKATKSKPEKIIISVELIPDYEKDYEIIPYSEDPEENKRNIEKFMKKYISKPFTYGDNVVGVEINFNKIFYKPEKLRDLNVIIEEIKQHDKELKQLEEDLGL